MRKVVSSWTGIYQYTIDQVLEDMVAFFTQFGAFPSGAPKLPYMPDKPEGMVDIQQTIAQMDSILSPMEAEHGAIP